jgi:hypothetical protein
MPRLLTPTSPRRRARLIPAALLIAAGLFGAPTAAAAGPSGASAGPAAAATYDALCGPVPAPFARCDALRRTDIAAVPALSPGTTTSAGGASPAAFTGYTPSNLRSAYGLPSSGGSGRTVAIVDAYDLSTAAADLAVYRAAFGLPACTVASGCFRKVDEHGGTSYPASGAKSGWGGEIELDMDMVSAICPGCKILLVEATTSNLSDLGTAVDTAVRLGAVAMSNSYGGHEWAAEGGLDPDYNHPGVAITAATGDYGWADGVEYPAASPYVVSVGGTTLTQPTPGAWTQTAWPHSGSGCSLYEPKPYWQTDTGCTNKTTADISADADPNTGVLVYDTTLTPSGWYVFGGTSVASPIVAAAIALAGRPAAGSYPSRLLYDSAASLRDVTSGSNGSCGTYLCQAQDGYDGPTGLGTPNGTAALVPDVLDLGAGSRTSCALTSDGTISCWGYDGHGEADAPAGSYVALGTGDSHSCAIDSGGALHCWGVNSNGESNPPAGSYVTVSAGGADTCAIDAAGALHCWGDSTYGVTSPPAGTYQAVSVGTYHACAINMSESLVCWGDNSHGQAAPPSGTFVAVSAGQYHTCALTSLAAISCWGNNSLGQLNAPAGAFIDLDAGANGACAVRLQGRVACWGDNSQGESSPPTVTASRVAMGAVHACAYLAGAIKCWGDDTYGQSTPLFATGSLPVAGSGFPYDTDITLASAVVPAPTFSVTSGSLPAGFTLSASGQLSGSSSSPGSYPFSVTASNGIAPAATQALTLVVDATPAPGAPTSVSAVASGTTAVVTWAAPIPNGGPAIESYTVTSSPPATGCVTLPTVLTCSFSGLTDRASYTFSVYATNSQGPGPAASATATPLFGATYITVTPNRIVDSRYGTRLGLKKSLSSGTPAEFTVVNQSPDPKLNIPAGAIAVTGNLTVTKQGAAGYLALTPEKPVGTPTTSTLNFPKGDNRANAVTISLSGTGTLWVTYVGTAGTSADVVFDATGYFVANSSGSTYVSLTPNRLVDSRAGTHLGLQASVRSGTPAWFTVVNRNPSDPTRNVPADATAVTGNLTVTNQHSAGYLALTPTKPSGTPTTSTLNFPTGDNRANAVTVPLTDGRLWVTFVGTAGTTTDVVFDVTGYFVGDASGATYVPLTPNRLVDPRLSPPLGLTKSLRSGTPAQFTVVGRSLDPALNVPSGAVAITGNLTVTNQTSSGYLTLTPSKPAGTPPTSTLNFPTGDNRANSVTVALSPTGTLWVTFIGGTGARTDVVFDVTGYFAP